MTVPFAPYSLFRASALASFDPRTGEGLDGIAPGVHLRVRVHPWIGFPIHPFAAWRLPHAGRGTPCPVAWRDEQGRPLPSVGGRVQLADRSAVAYGTILGAAPQDPWLWVEVDADRGMRLDLIDPRAVPGVVEPRVLGTRRDAPYRFGHGPILRLRARGPGSIGPSRGMPLSGIDVVHPSILERPTTFGLPLRVVDPEARTVAWYAPGADPIGAAAARLARGAPHRMSPPDELVLPAPDPWDRARDVERILRSTGPDLVDPFLVAGFHDAGVAPIDAAVVHEDRSRHRQPLRTRAPVVGSLLTSAMDPSIARYLGLATTMPLASPTELVPAGFWLVAGRFAVQEGRVVLPGSGAAGTGLSLGELLAGSLAPAVYADALDREFPDAIALRDEIPGRKTSVEGAWRVVTLLTIAVAVGDAPPDRPDPVSLGAAGPRAWNSPADRKDAEDWQQSLSLGRSGVRGVLGFARMAPGDAVPLHRIVPEPGRGFDRRVLPLVADGAGREPVRLTDRHVPSHPDGATWRVWQADEFGRWSDPAECSADLPSRPPPPPPVAEPRFVAAPDDASVGPRSPGSIVLRYEVPRAADGVPGSRPVSRLTVHVDGVQRADRAVAEGTVVEVTIDAAPCEVGAQRTVRLRSGYVDADGRRSDETSPIATVSCRTFDTRAPRPLSTSPVLVWSGRPDAVDGSEIALRWPRRTGAHRYGVYLGDGLRLAGEIPIAVPGARERAAWARPIVDRSASLPNKRAFTFLGEILDPGVGAPEVTWRTRVQGGLRTVQFLRIVPISEGGAEPPFASCGLVPVAVPSSERPPAPLLEASTASDGSVRLRLRALGLRADVLEASPGRMPEFRLLRATDDDRDPAYARPFHRGVLRPSSHGEWIAEVEVAAEHAPPWVRTTWTAEVRYPAEPSLPSGAVPVLADVLPVWPDLGANSESLWSEPSGPAGTLYVPSEAPAAPAAPIFLGDLKRVTLVALGLPVAPARSIAPYRLEIHRRIGAGALRLAVDFPISSPQESWVVPDDGLDARFHLVVVDPLGRRSPPSP